MSEPSATYESLDQVLELCWSMLEAGVSDRRAPFHLPMLCTVASDGSPSSRIVVMREADREKRVVRCHTDRRSPKIEHIGQNDRVAWVFYDQSAKVQLRLGARATVHAHDRVAREAWESSQLTSRRCYLAPAAPGATAEHPSPNLPEAFRSGVPSEHESARGFDQFAVIRTTCHEMDWLYLGSRGHVRARFEWDRGGELVTSTWLEP